MSDTLARVLAGLGQADPSGGGAYPSRGVAYGMPDFMSSDGQASGDDVAQVWANLPPPARAAIMDSLFTPTPDPAISPIRNWDQMLGENGVNGGRWGVGRVEPGRIVRHNYFDSRGIPSNAAGLREWNRVKNSPRMRGEVASGE